MITATIFGATGLIGRHLLDQCLEDPSFQKIRIVVRNKIKLDHKKLIQIQASFDELEKLPADVYSSEVLFCALGTTIKKAKTKEAFRKVDFIYPKLIAELASRNSCQKFIVISSMGANSSSLFFYSQVKGEMEEALRKVTIPQIYILRPSLLLGHRDRENRILEKITGEITRPLSFLLKGPLLKYRPIEAKQVAAKMIETAKIPRSHGSKFEIIESNVLQL